MKHFGSNMPNQGLDMREHKRTVVIRWIEQQALAFRLEGDRLTLGNLDAEQGPALSAIQKAGFVFDYGVGYFRSKDSRQRAAQLLGESLANAGFDVRIM